MQGKHTVEGLGGSHTLEGVERQKSLQGNSRTNPDQQIWSKWKRFSGASSFGEEIDKSKWHEVMNSILGRVNSKAKQLVAFGPPSFLFSAGFTNSARTCTESSWENYSSQFADKTVHPSYGNNVQPEEVSGNVDPGSAYRQAIKFQRPTVVPWRKELSNTVHLMGIIGVPVEIQTFKSGGVWAKTSLGVEKSANSKEYDWFSVTFSDVLAEVAAQHLKKNDHVYVSGRLISRTRVDADQKPQTFYQIVANDLNFIQSNLQVHPHERVGNTTITLSKQDDQKISSTSKKWVSQDIAEKESLWQVFFANPFEWWDNRTDKKNPRCPDFRHKDTGEALWIDSRHTPKWVKSQLAVLDSRIKKSRQWKGGISSIAF